MPQVDFYILNKQGLPEAEHFMCRLMEKIWAQGYSIYIHAHSQYHAQHIDKMLWHYKVERFIPHQLYDHLDDVQKTLPIHIGYQEDVYIQKEVLINFAETCPHFYSHFDRVVEILDMTEHRRKAGRQRYRVYQQAGCDVQSHTMTAN